MNGYRGDKLKSALLYGVCALVLAAALFGVCRMVSAVVMNARIRDYLQSVAASVEYAEQHNSMRVSVDGCEPVKIHFRRASDFHAYLATTPTILPASQSAAGESHAAIDCGDGSLIDVWDAGERHMRLQYVSPAGKRFRFTLQYHTAYDGWNGFLRTVSGEYRPG